MCISVCHSARSHVTKVKLLILSFRVLNTTLFESWEIIGPYPSWWVFNSLLLLLQALHVFWFYLIVRLLCRAVSRGKVSAQHSRFTHNRCSAPAQPPGGVMWNLGMKN